jgi:hypothetical protein
MAAVEHLHFAGSDLMFTIKISMVTTDLAASGGC